MLSKGGYESTIERFIAWLTIALGIGVLIPRKGFGLYQLLHDSGEGLIFAVLLNGVGVALIFATYLPWRRLRLLLLVLVLVVWGVLATKFFAASLWGATMQAVVVIVFTISGAYRIWTNQ